MPSDEGVRLDDGQSLSPCKQSGKQHQGKPGSIPGSARFDLALEVQSQLLAEEKVLSGQSAMGPQAEPDEPEGIQQWIESGQQQVGRELSFGINDRIAHPGASFDGMNRDVQNYCGLHHRKPFCWPNEETASKRAARQPRRLAAFLMVGFLSSEFRCENFFEGANDIALVVTREAGGYRQQDAALEEAIGHRTGALAIFGDEALVLHEVPGKTPRPRWSSLPG